MGDHDSVVDPLAPHNHDGVWHIHGPDSPVAFSLSVSVTISFEDSAPPELVVAVDEQIRAARAEQGRARESVRAQFEDLSFASQLILVADDYVLEAAGQAVAREALRRGIVSVEMTPVESSNVEAVGWRGFSEGAEFGDLIVRFRGGGTYVYQGVAGEVYQELLAAESVGRFINSVIKPRYGVERIDVAIDGGEA